MSKLYYVMDPMCGWCYGFSPVAKRLFEVYGEKLDMELLPAGLWLGDGVHVLNPDRCDYIRNANKRITELSGQEFGEDFYTNYFDKGIPFDSLPSCKAIITAQTLIPNRSYTFTSRIQEAFCLLGKDMNDPEVFFHIAKDMNIDGFKDYYNSEDALFKTQSAFSRAKDLGVTNYPTVLLEHKGNLHTLAVGYASFEDIEESINDILDK